MQISRQLLISGTLWSAAAQLVVMLINLLVLPLFIKNLGAELYGIWVISGIILGYLAVFDFGFTQGLQKYIAEARIKKDDQELSEVVMSGIGLLLGIGIVLGGLCFFFADAIVEFFNIQPGNYNIAKKLLRISALFSVIMWPLRIVDVGLNACLRIKELSLLNAFKQGAYSITMLCLVITAQDLILIKWVTAVLLASCSGVGLLLLRRYMPEIRWAPHHFKFSQLRRMHRFSLGMFYIAMLGMLITQIDSLIIGRVLTMTAVATYAVVAKPFQIIQRFTGMLMTTLVPAVYNLNAQSDHQRIEKLVYNAVKYRLFISVPAAFASILVAHDFIRLWAGEEFLPYAFWCQVLCVVPIFTGLGVGNSVARACGHVASSNIIFSISILVNFGLSLWLIHTFGIGGPICGTVFSVILIGDFTMFPFFCRLIGIPWRATYFLSLKMAAVGFIVFGVGRLVHQAVELNTWGGLIFFVSLWGGLCVGILGVVFMRTEISRFIHARA